MTDRPTNQQTVRRTDQVIGMFHFQQEAVKDELLLTEAVPDVPPPSGQDNLSRTTGSLYVWRVAPFCQGVNQLTGHITLCLLQSRDSVHPQALMAEKTGKED